MAEEIVPAPTRIDAQLVFVKEHLPIGKSNLFMDLQKMQKNHIFHISVDILQNTNFFKAFTASADNDNLLRNALEITPIDSAHPYVPPLDGDLIMDFVNNLGYLEEIHFVSKIRPQFPVHITKDDYPLKNLKFFSKRGMDDVFRMPIPKDMITDAIRNSEYYSKYLEMAARKPPEACKKENLQDDSFKEIYKGKKSSHLVDEDDDEMQPASEPQMEDDEYDLQREEIASWDGGKSTWEGRVRVFGTVLVCVRIQERAGVRDEFWRE
nr:hypothetical protein [Tanacetum cinerariifolium]